LICFFAKHAALGRESKYWLRSKNKDWLAQNQNNVSEWSDMSILVPLFSELALRISNSACSSRTKRTSSLFHWM